MAFRIKDCAIPTVWCGNGAVPNAIKNNGRYTKAGTPHECMKKGFGAGKYSERDKNLPKNSLQHIKYVGAVYEGKFQAEGITSLVRLKSVMRGKTPAQIRTVLQRVFKKGKGIDKRGYNSTVFYLYQNGFTNVPQCSRI